MDPSRGLDPGQNNGASMKLFRKKPETDIELHSRVDRLQSECRQARLHCESLPDDSDKRNRLEVLEAAEQDLAEARSDGEDTTRTRAALRVEAELCLTKPFPMLVPTANRLRDKLYRLDDRERDAWEKELDGSISNGDVLREETLRIHLQLLTYRVTEAAHRYRRLAKDRSNAISDILRVSLLIVTILLCGLVFSFNCLMLGAGHGISDSQDGASGDALSWARLTMVLLAGGLGAMVNIVPATIAAEKKRLASSSTYIWHMLVRMILGSVYAFIVYSATLAHVLPIAIPANPMTAIAFLAVLAFASGYSDRLFGQVLNRFITGTTNSSKTKRSADSGA